MPRIAVSEFAQRIQMPQGENQSVKIKFNGFLSYSHAADGNLAPAIQSALQRFARPWYRLRSLWIFRDKTSLSANPQLWPAIERALNASEYFLLLASPEAAESAWVRREVAWWLANRSAETILLLITDGVLQWDAETGDFDWHSTNVLPLSLRKQYASQPLYVDFRWAKTEERLSLRHSGFRSAILDVAATLLKKPKDVLDGDDVRVYRRNRLVAGAAILITLLLAVGAAWQAVVARMEAKIALAGQLAAESQLVEKQRLNLLPQSALLAVQSLRLSFSLQAADSLRTALALMPELTSSMSHNDYVNTLAFSPDGSYLATAAGKNLAVWDCRTGQTVARMSHRDEIWDVAFSPDGKLLATASKDKTARVWSSLSGKEVAMLSHAAGVNTIRFSPTGEYVATGSSDGVARVWRLSSASAVGRYLHKASVTSVAFSPDGESVASASLDGTAAVWKELGGRRTMYVNHGHHPVFYVSFSRNGAYLATAGEDGTGRVWSLKSRKEFARLTHSNIVNRIVFSPDSRFVATASADGTAGIFDLSTHQELPRRIHESEVRDVTFSADGSYFATASLDETGRIWSTMDWHEVSRVIHSGGVGRVQFSPDGLHFATGGWDKLARVWEVRNHATLDQVPIGDDVPEVSFSRDGKLLATTGSEVATIRDANSLSILANLAHDKSIVSLVFAPGAKLVATGSFDHTARVWDAATGMELKCLPHDHDVESVTFSADGKYLLTITGNITAKKSTPPTDYRSAQMWEIATGKRINKVPLLETRGVAFSPDGRFLAVRSESLPPEVAESSNVDRNNSVYLVDFETGRKIKDFHHDGSVINVLFNPSGDSIATSAEDGTITVWDYAGPRLWMRHDNDSTDFLKYSSDGKYLAAIGASIRVWEARTGRRVSKWGIDGAEDASFSPDSAYLATRSRDLIQGPNENAVNVWCVHTGEEVARIKISSSVSSFAFSPDGTRIAVAGSAGQLELWCWNSKTLIREACERLTTQRLSDPQLRKACVD